MDPREFDYDEVEPCGAGYGGLTYDGPEINPDIEAAAGGGALLIFADGVMRPMTEADVARLLVADENKRDEAEPEV